MVRRDWLNLMLKIANPVLTNLEAGTLWQNLPVEKPDRAPYAHLEAFGRTLTGLAPWLELEGLDREERELQEKTRKTVLTCLNHATDPGSPDRMNFSEGYGQALVDAAFLAHGLLRATKSIMDKLDDRVRGNLVGCLKSTRVFEPFPSNWLLFSAIIEAALFALGEKWETGPVDRAVNAMERWYVGDGMYSDGERFHFDYYNSFVIHPMYVDVLWTLAPVMPRYRELLPKALSREARYAAILEQMIAPEGTYPITGRSITYRFGAFHALSHAALIENLPPELVPNQVRCALSAALERTARGNLFDGNGFLKVGIVGAQPGLGEGYICVGSAYLCEAVFLPLGLSPEHPFWSGPETDWTSKKVWSGADLPCDHALD